MDEKQTRAMCAILRTPSELSQEFRNDVAAEVWRLREALHNIMCNTEPGAIRHRDRDCLRTVTTMEKQT